MQLFLTVLGAARGSFWLRSLHHVCLPWFNRIIPSTVCFLMVGPEQNAGSLLTPFSDTVFDALSHGTLGFALHGSYLNHFLIGGNSSTANQIRWNMWLLKLPWKAKPRVPCGRASKTILETGVKSDPAFCLGSSIEKTNSGTIWIHQFLRKEISETPHIRT